MPEVIINGSEGRLQGRYQPSKDADGPIALILHPHPQHGGTMNNKVVYTAYQTFVKRGYSALRFNFRGVGRSLGTFDRGDGELSDAAAALDWLQSYNPNARACWIAGFSFGAWIGMQLLMRRPEINGFITISPPANSHDFSFLAPCPASGMVLHGEDDDVVPHDSVAQLVEKLSKQKGIKIDYRLQPGVGHFYQDRLDIIEDNLNSYLDAREDK